MRSPKASRRPRPARWCRRSPATPIAGPGEPPRLLAYSDTPVREPQPPFATCGRPPMPMRAGRSPAALVLAETRRGFSAVSCPHSAKSTAAPPWCVSGTRACRRNRCSAGSSLSSVSTRWGCRASERCSGRPLPGHGGVLSTALGGAPPRECSEDGAVSSRRPSRSTAPRQHQRLEGQLLQKVADSTSRPPAHEIGSTVQSKGEPAGGDRPAVR